MQMTGLGVYKVYKVKWWKVEWDREQYTIQWKQQNDTIHICLCGSSVWFHCLLHLATQFLRSCCPESSTTFLIHLWQGPSQALIDTVNLHYK